MSNLIDRLPLNQGVAQGTPYGEQPWAEGEEQEANWETAMALRAG